MYGPTNELDNVSNASINLKVLLFFYFFILLWMSWTRNIFDNDVMAPNHSTLFESPARMK